MRAVDSRHIQTQNEWRNIVEWAEKNEKWGDEDDEECGREKRIMTTSDGRPSHTTHDWMNHDFNQFVSRWARCSDGIFCIVYDTYSSIALHFGIAPWPAHGQTHKTSKWKVFFFFIFHFLIETSTYRARDECSTNQILRCYFRNCFRVSVLIFTQLTHTPIDWRGICVYIEWAEPSH